MANNYNTVKKEELVEELENKNVELTNVKKELEDKTTELTSMKSDIESLKIMIESLQRLQFQKEDILTKKTNISDDGIAKIGSCLIGRHILCDFDGREIVDLIDFGDVASIRVRLLDTIMTATNKDLFRKGLIYFLDEEFYDRQSIKRDIIIDDKTLDELYKLPIQTLLSEITKITKNKTETAILYTIYWKIVKNIAEGREGYHDRNKEIELSAYFGVDISNSINLLACAKEQNFK